MLSERFFSIAEYPLRQTLGEVVETPWGKAIALLSIGVVLGSFGLIGWPSELSDPSSLVWFFAWLGVVACAYWPSQRWTMVGVFSAIGWFYLPWFHWSVLGATPWWHLVCWVCGVGCCYSGYLFWQLRYRTYPFLMFLSAFLLIIVSLSHFSLSPAWSHWVWGFLLTISASFWYFGYSLQNLPRLQRGVLWREPWTYLPFWGGTATPYTQGRLWLERIAADSPEAYTRCLLGALELLGLALLWFFMLRLIGFFYLELHWPTLMEALTYVSQGGQYPWYEAWGICLLNFFRSLIYLAFNGHLIIGLCRAAGFMAPRNTNSPLMATSIADFWNRYYFYFKELLVHFFFYPTYFSCFKTYPRIRVFFATFMAAGIGNCLYHFLAHLALVYRYGLLNTLFLMRSYVIYSVLLSLGIAVSQWRLQKALKKELQEDSVSHVKVSAQHDVRTGIRYFWVRGWDRFFTSLTVVGFYLLISPFAQPYQPFSPAVNYRFLLSLFNG